MTANVGVSTRRRDWFRILRDLAAVGIKYHDVARKCNRAPKTVWSWAEEDVDPKEADARVVLALYAKFCPLKYVDHQREFEIKVWVETGGTGEVEVSGGP